MVMSRKTGFKAISNKFFSDKLFYCFTKALCPVLITSTSQTDFSFHKGMNIWHIQRHDLEKEIVHSGVRLFGIDPTSISIKSLAQWSFISDFWKSIVTYTKNHDKELIKSLSGFYNKESNGLLILVNRMKGMFEIFLKDEAFQIISQYDIPILILPSKASVP